MKTLYLPFSRMRTWLRSSSKVLLPAALFFGLEQNVQAQFPRNVSFKDDTAPDFTFRGAARLTGTGTTGDDAIGQGYLRLTSNAQNTAGSIIDNVGFDAPDGFTISFEFFAYGGSGADGFSVFLVDEFGQPATGFRIGASGGSLGYAQKTETPVADGVSRGYIGIGIDEFGNFANPTEGRVGGPGPIPDAISIRGAGNGRSTTDYPYITGTGLNQLGFSLDVPTTRAQPGSADYRRAFIDVIPTGTGTARTYDITVRIQHGTEVTTAVKQVRVTTPPARLRLGFSGSTGGSTNFHEIRNLNIVQAPFAVDDVASTIHNTPVTLNVTSNDAAPGASINRATVDLDIDAPGIQDTRTIPNQGTFTVTSTGAVTFTPVSTFAGTVMLPYNVRDILDQVSSPANIVITVQGADVATSVSGPSFATAGSSITYSMTTTNLGTELATNVVPTLRLSPLVSQTGMVLPTGASYDPRSGVVTFATIPNLAAGAAAAVTNSVTFTLPATASLSGTASSISGIPDPVAGNNTAIITTNIGGSVNVVTACATPGKDGPVTLAADAIPNTYFPGTATSTTNGISTITLGDASSTATGTASIAVGDLVLVMQMQGLDINTADNTAAYGTPNGINTAGQYEYAVAASAVALTGGNRTLTLASPLTKTYTNADFGGTLSGQRRFQVIRVPQYSALTITGSVTGQAWNGRTGGVLVVDVAGKTTMSGTTAGLSMTAKGFRGGGGRGYSGGNATYTANDYRNLTATGTTRTAAHATKGEGIAGTPRYTYIGTGTTVADNTAEGYRNGSLGRGAPGNAGGGGTSSSANNNNGNAGGAGGGNRGAGGLGGFPANSGPTGSGNQAIGGAVSSSSTTALTMGGGGGAGGTNSTTTVQSMSSGGVGGGVIIFRTGSVSGSGQIQSNGGAAPGIPNETEAGGGGGAGGTVLILATPPIDLPNGLNGLAVSATGGRGGNASTLASLNALVGPGGGGGGGAVYTNGTLASPANVSGGAHGVTTNNLSYGSDDGDAGAAATNADETTNAGGIAGSGACLPILTASLRTSTPRVTRTGDPGQPVNPASYTLEIVNTGGIANNVSALISLAVNGATGTDGPFRYQSSGTTVQLRSANGTLTTLTAGTNYSAPVNNGITANFTGLTLPAGATLIFNFQASVAGNVQDNLIYQSTASVTYSDPTRATAGRITGPSRSYEAGGDAPGSNYSGTDPRLTAEDVIIARPLPVELKRFDVAAQSLNAELTWATASELQNDRFNIERSLDGKNFERINVVKGQGTSSKEVAYRYTDAGAGRLSLKPIYYRLQQVDLDGSSSYSPIRVVKFERGTKAAITLYPNPHQGTATLDLTALSTLDSQVEVMDISGRLVGKFQLLGGLQHQLDLHTLPLGSYLIRVCNAETVVTLPMIRN